MNLTILSTSYKLQPTALVLQLPVFVDLDGFHGELVRYFSGRPTMGIGRMIFSWWVWVFEVCLLLYVTQDAIVLKIQRQKPRVLAYAPFTSDTDSQRILLTCQSRVVHQWPGWHLNSSFWLQSCTSYPTLAFPRPARACAPPSFLGHSQAEGRGTGRVRAGEAARCVWGASPLNQQQLTNEIFLEISF